MSFLLLVRVVLCVITFETWCYIIIFEAFGYATYVPTITLVVGTRTLNRLHPAFQLTFEKKHDSKFPFLGILVKRIEYGFETSV